MDRRALKRRHLIYYLRVFDASNGQVLGHLVDITTQGIMLISETGIPEGTPYTLRMALPFMINGKKEIQLSAVCRYCKQDINPDFFSAGFQVENADDPEVMETIERLIKQYGFND